MVYTKLHSLKWEEKDEEVGICIVILQKHHYIFYRSFRLKNLTCNGCTYRNRNDSETEEPSLFM